MFVLGALMLFDPAGDAYQVSMPVAIGIAAGLALLLGFAMTRALRAARQPAAVGVQGMVGDEAVVRREGMVQVNGELWRARTVDGGGARAGRARPGRATSRTTSGSS